MQKQITAVIMSKQTEDSPLSEKSSKAKLVTFSTSNAEIQKKSKSDHKLELKMNVNNLNDDTPKMEPDWKQCSMVQDLISAFTKLGYFSERMKNDANYFFIAVLADAGHNMGLSKEMAIKLAAQTFQSAVESADKHSTGLLNFVTSHEGENINDIQFMGKTHCLPSFQEAIEASYHRLKGLIGIEPVAKAETNYND